VVVKPALSPNSPPFAKDAKDGVPASTSSTSPLPAKEAGNGAPQVTAAVPTHAVTPATADEASAAPQAISTHAAPTDNLLRDEEGNLVTIYAQADTRPPGNLVTNIALDAIDKNPYQTRYLFDKELLEELADSIRANGVVQPVVVRPAEEDGRYILILGERRCRASKLAGKTTVPAIVKRVSAQQAAEMTVIENLQRQDLNCLEQAEAFRVLSGEFRLTQQEIGDRVGMSRESVSNYMRLLKLPKSVMEYLANNQMGFSEARQLLTLDDPETIAKAADEVVRKHMSIEQIEDLVIKLESLPVKTEKKGGARWVDPNVRAAQMEIERMLGLRVRIRDRKGKGKIVIEYATVDDYERVVGRLRG
jgi:ParB family transcriptional regulator, chromosome partitioning protein